VHPNGGVPGLRVAADPDDGRILLRRADTRAALTSIGMRQTTVERLTVRAVLAELIRNGADSPARSTLRARDSSAPRRSRGLTAGEICATLGKV
jgi:hypothetical protein